MPKVSIVIPAYNVENYIGACLKSVLNQTLKDIEAIVVNDCSSDSTERIIQEIASTDSRVKVIAHESNQKLHLARKTGVEAANGEVLIFLDGDDALAPDFCERIYERMSEDAVDVLHYGVTVVAENGLSEHERSTFEAFVNKPSLSGTGMESAQRIFIDYAEDWRTVQRAYRASFAKKAFAKMTNEKLNRAEDAYETFVLVTSAGAVDGLESCKGYIYHYGRGITGESAIDANTFLTFSRNFKGCIDATEGYAGANEILSYLCSGMKRKAIELLANDWLVRVADSEKNRAAQYFAEVFGSAIADREFFRFVRDRAYEYVSANSLPENDKQFELLKTIAAKYFADEGEPAEFEQAWDMRDQAALHVGELDDARRDERYGNQDIRILVAAHKEVQLFDSDILQPIQVGSAWAVKRFPGVLQDDAGENISTLNSSYCELTAQYWAWKNLESEYVGLCHYRRYFDFSECEHEENGWGEVMAQRVDSASQVEYGLDDETIRNVVSNYDVITTRFQDIRDFPDEAETPSDQWHYAASLHDEDFINCMAIVEDMHPEYEQDIETFVRGNHACFCNMFIMRKPIFDEYCTWLFPILERFCAITDMSLYSKEALRTPGHLSERLLNIFLIHKKREGVDWKFKELQCVHFEDPDKVAKLEPYRPSEIGMLPVVPVVFAADGNYVPMVTTTIYSMLRNASTDRFYDIVILSRGISWEKQETMRQFFAQFENTRLRFYDAARLVAVYDLSTNNEHIGIETYYRFLIQDVMPFYNKVVYLDSDLIVQDNVAELYDTVLGDNLIAATHDIDYQGNLNVKGGKRLQYTQEILGMKHPYDYFQAGVLVLNTRAMRDLMPMHDWLAAATNDVYIYNDQDILNKYCEGRVVFLDQSWNVMNDCGGRINNVFKNAPNDSFDKFNAARFHERIIHYAGYQKPWSDPATDRQEVYWSYARETPFYEDLISRLAKVIAAAQMPKTPEPPKPPKAIREDNPIRKIADPLLPMDSTRREVAKAVVRKMRGL